MRIGLVSDTHDRVDPHLATLFAGCDLILHAGDVTREPVLAALRRTAPVQAARGNNDAGPFGDSLPERLWVPLGPLTALVVHEAGPRRPAPPLARALAGRPAEIVLFGHSHRPEVLVGAERLWVNPGSAGPRRFSLPRTAGLLHVRGREATVELFDLAGDAPVPLGAPVVATL